MPAGKLAATDDSCASTTEIGDFLSRNSSPRQTCEYHTASFSTPFANLSMLQIGPYKLPNRVALAPMAGVTDLPFRRLCARIGCRPGGVRNDQQQPAAARLPQNPWRSRHDGEIEPRSVQIAGNDPRKWPRPPLQRGQGAQIIDINMGCPAKKVCRKAAGSALLADEALVADILTRGGQRCGRAGYPENSHRLSPARSNGVTIARIAEDAGIAALAVHGRTRACAFKGEVEYDTIADIVAATDFPVFANGDIDSPDKAAAVIATPARPAS